MLRRVEYDSMGANTYNMDPDVNYAIKYNRRKKGILRKSQIYLLYTYDKKLVDSNNGFPPSSF